MLKAKIMLFSKKEKLFTIVYLAAVSAFVFCAAPSIEVSVVHLFFFK